MKDEIKEIVEKLCSFDERQLEQNEKAREFIISFFEKESIKYCLFSFETEVPRFKSFGLKADGKNIECTPTGLVSGNINNNFNIISSLTSSQDFLYKENINFNPLCDSISKANFYFAPSLAINRDMISVLCKAEKIDGFIDVEKMKFESKSILVGNLKNPKNIVFSHFDSIGPGAIDNASGTAVCINLVLKNREFLEDTLFVFDSNEEISYDTPVYWGHGYREFEKRYFKLLMNVEKILVVDCVGYSKTEFIRDKNILKLAFPIVNLSELSEKIVLFSGDFNKLMKVYQSPIDLPNVVSEEFLRKSLEEIKEYLKI